MPPRRQQYQPQPQRTQPARKYEPPAKRRMELIASVSRSSGLEKDGDALRDFKLQEEYRGFIQEKVDDYWRRFPLGDAPGDNKHRDEMRGNICILFRKLREGILSTKRNDSFALEVYETSLYLSILFSSPKDTASAISHLIPGMYKGHPRLPVTASMAVITSLLYFLVAAYPSQSRFSEHWDSVPRTYVSEEGRTWLHNLTRALRQHNYARLEQLTSRTAVGAAVGIDAAQPRGPRKTKPDTPYELAIEALCNLLNSLRSRARDTTWAILRSAYRELSCPKPTDTSGSTFTRDWLLRSLLLRSVASQGDTNDEVLLDNWIKERVERAELRAKEGVEGRWIVCKVKT